MVVPYVKSAVDKMSQAVYGKVVQWIAVFVIFMFVIVLCEIFSQSKTFQGNYKKLQKII